MKSFHGLFWVCWEMIREGNVKYSTLKIPMAALSLGMVTDMVILPHAVLCQLGEKSMGDVNHLYNQWSVRPEALHISTTRSLSFPSVPKFSLKK